MNIEYDYRVPTDVAKKLQGIGYPQNILSIDGDLVPGHYVILNGWKLSYENGTTKLTDYPVYPHYFNPNKYRGIAIEWPSYAGAINWFRVEKGIYCDIIKHEDNNYEALVMSSEKIITVGNFDTFKEAQLETIKEAIECCVSC